jgi:hypothetical protein
MGSEKLSAQRRDAVELFIKALEATGEGGLKSLVPGEFSASTVGNTIVEGAEVIFKYIYPST